MPAKQPKVTDDAICSMLHGLIDENLSLSAANRKLAHGRLEEWVKTLSGLRRAWDLWPRP
jgi:hypothetical protein